MSDRPSWDSQFRETESERQARWARKRHADRAKLAPVPVDAPPLQCPGVGRDAGCATALEFYFDRPVTDDEMRFLHEVIQRAVACMPRR